MKEIIQGWLFLNGRAVSVKCYHWRGNSSRLIQVIRPRKYLYIYTTKRELPKSKAACLRRQLRITKAEFDSLVVASDEIRARITEANALVVKLKKQLKKIQ
jgi:hypothetical protein